MAVLRFLDDVIGPGCQLYNLFFGSSFFGNKAVIRVLRRFDPVSSVSGYKIMTQKPKFWQK